MDSKTIWTVVLVSLIVAGIVAFVTVKITANVINVYPSAAKGYPVYTQADVDAMLKDGKSSLNVYSLSANQSNFGSILLNRNKFDSVMKYRTDISAGGVRAGSDSDNYTSSARLTEDGIEISDQYMNRSLAFNSLYLELGRLQMFENGITTVQLNKQGLYLTSKNGTLFSCRPSETGVFTCVRA